MRAATAMRPFAGAWRRGALIRTIRTIIPTTAAPPTTAIATAAASATPRACVPCSPCGRAISRSSTRAARGCATTRPTPISWTGWRGRASLSTWSPTRTWMPRARRSSLPIGRCSRARIPSTTPCAPTTRTRAISRAGDGSSIWAVTASTGASRPARSCPASSRCAARRRASARGRRGSASITTRSTAPMEACGGATAGLPSSSSAWASRGRDSSRARTIGGSPGPTIRARPGYSPGSTRR